MNFADRLDQAIHQRGNPICVGLDPRLDQLPAKLVATAVAQHGPSARAAAEAFIAFNTQIIDAVADIAPVCKPQVAFYEELGWEGLRAYEATVQYAKKKGMLVISDAKRGDIGNTAQAYAKAHLASVRLACSQDELTRLLKSEAEAFAGFDADALTVNPYMGRDTLEPFLKVVGAAERGIFVLVKTSNKGSGDLQDLEINSVCEAPPPTIVATAGAASSGFADSRSCSGTPIYERVAEMVHALGQSYRGTCGLNSVGAVVGATYPEQARELRALMPETIFLIPGYGAQGGSAADAAAGFRSDGRGAIVNSSRGIIFAYKQAPFSKTFGEADFAGAARAATLQMAAELQQALQRK